MKRRASRMPKRQKYPEPSSVDRARMKRLASGLSIPAESIAQNGLKLVKPSGGSIALRSLHEVTQNRHEFSAQDASSRVMDSILSRAQIAEYLSVTTKTISKLVKEQGLPSFFIGKEYRFRLSDVDQWTGRHTEPASARKGA